MIDLASSTMTSTLIAGGEASANCWFCNFPPKICDSHFYDAGKMHMPVTSPLANQPVPSPKAGQPESNPEAGKLEARPQAGKPKASPHLDIGLVELAIGISSDEGISRGLLVQRLKVVSFPLSISFAVSC
jgi:hypothetical protein